MRAIAPCGSKELTQVRTGLCYSSCLALGWADLVSGVNSPVPHPRASLSLHGSKHEAARLLSFSSGDFYV